MRLARHQGTVTERKQAAARRCNPLLEKPHAFRLEPRGHPSGQFVCSHHGLQLGFGEAGGELFVDAGQRLAQRRQLG
jgi:hypothetical protein